MANDSKNVGFRTVLLTAIITAVLTTISQQLLQSNKLKEEQEYWNRRYKIEAIDKVNTQKFQLMEELNKDLLQLEVLAQRIKIETAGLKYNKDPQDVQKVISLHVKYQEGLNLYASKTQMAAIYFGHQVDSLIPVLGEALSINFSNNLIKINSGPELPEFELNFATVDTLTKVRLSFIKSMYYDIINSYDLKSEK